MAHESGSGEAASSAAEPESAPVPEGGGASGAARGGGRRRWLVVPGVVAAVCLTIIAVVAVSYGQHVARHREQTWTALSEVARLKASEVALWVREREADAGILLDDTGLARNCRLWFVEGRPQEFARDSVPFLESVARRHGYTVLAVLDATGTVRYSVSNRPVADVATVDSLLTQAAATRKVVCSDLYLGKDGTPYIDWLVPLFAEAGTDRGSLVGGVLLRADPARYLYPLLASWPGREPTAETLLVRRDGKYVVYLNPLRFRRNAALRFRRRLDSPGLPAARVVRGETGVLEGIDYRGADVLAAYRPVPGTDWGIMAKVDSSDVYAPVTREAWLVVALVAALLGVGGLTVGLVWRRHELGAARAEARVAAERAALSEHYALLTRHASDAILLHDEDLRIVECNDRAADLYGYSREELLTMSVPDLLAPGATTVSASAETTPRDVQAQLEAGKSVMYQTRHRRKDGGELDVEISARTVEAGGRRFTQQIVRDVSARVAAEQALAERERMLSTLLGNLPGMAYRCRNTGGWPLEFASEGCRDLTGYAPEELVGEGSVPFEDLIHPDDRATVRAEVEWALRSGGHFTVTYRIRRRDGQERWVWDRGQPVGEPGLRATTHEGFMTDITDRVLAEVELRALSEDLERRVEDRTADLRNANQELEAFSYSVSHDLRAPLRAIDGFSLALAEDYGETLPAEGREYLDRVRAASQRMAELIDDLLALSRVGRAEMSLQRVDLSALVDQVVEEIRSLRGQDDVVYSVARGAAAVADPHLVRVLLMNLIDNARKFSLPVEHPRVEFGFLDGEEQGQATFFVRDNGVGFDPTYAERLFAPFQRFHAPGEFEGTGIGLATARRVVRRHGGWIWAESAPGEGATFYFTFGGASDRVTGDEDRGPASEAGDGDAGGGHL